MALEGIQGIRTDTHTAGISILCAAVAVLRIPSSGTLIFKAPGLQHCVHKYCLIPAGMRQYLVLHSHSNK